MRKGSGIGVVALAVFLAWAPAGQAQIQPVESLMAVDALGRELGLVVRVDYGLQRMQVAMEVDGELALIHVLSDSFSHGSRAVVYYANRSCAGGAYMAAQAGGGGFGGRIAVAGPRGTLYRGLGEPRMMMLRSVQQGDTCVELGSPQIEVVDALWVLDLVDSFTPPYHLVPIEPSEPGSEDEQDPSTSPRPGLRRLR